MILIKIKRIKNNNIILLKTVKISNKKITNNL